MNDAHEKHQAISKKNVATLEQQIETLTKELTEIKRKNLSDISAKTEEVTRLTFKVEEYASTIETLKAEMTLKDNRIKELSKTSNISKLM